MEIAAHCGVAESYVRKLKTGSAIFAQSEDKPVRTVKRGASTYTQNTAKIGKSRPALPAPVEAPAPEAEPEAQVLAPDTPLSLLQEAVGRAQSLRNGPGRGAGARAGKWAWTRCEALRMAVARSGTST